MDRLHVELLKERVVWIGLLGRPTWSLNNKELFQIGLLDHPHVGGVQIVDRPSLES